MLYDVNKGDMPAMGKGRRKYGFSFSRKRALGISSAKARISRKIGIPLTRSGRQRKMGRMMGCCVYVIGISIIAIWALLLIIW